MSNFGDSNNYESYPYYEPTSNGQLAHQVMSHTGVSHSAGQQPPVAQPEMNGWPHAATNSRSWNGQRFNGHESNEDSSIIVSL